MQVEALQSNGQEITSIKTNKGDYSADKFVLAAGSYSPVLAKTLKLKLPIRPIKGYSITLDMTDWESKPRMPVIDEEVHVAITPFGKRLRAAGTAELHGYNTEINPLRIQLVLDQVINRYSSAEPYKSSGDIHPWAGLRPTTADGVPIIGTSRYRNLFFNTGHGHLGWSLAMGSGKIVSDMINGHKPAVNVSPYSLDRF